jgi:alpha-L-arabinofuranosidase
MRTPIRAGLAALAACTAVATAVTTAGTAAGATPPTVTVDTTHPSATLQPGAVGVNDPIWNPVFTAPGTADRIRAAGIGTLEFNGGPASDLYHWRTGTVQADPDPTGHPDYTSLTPAFTFAQFEATARQTGARTLVHLNYGTGTPQEAAAWVADARQHHQKVDGWIIGEETWGNGSIPGVDFEPDGHADKSPQAYARGVLEFVAAIKAVDPSAKIGIELFGVPGAEAAWDRPVLQIAGRAVDFVDIHAYPFGLTDTSDASLLAQPRTAPAQQAAVQRLLDAYARPGTRIVVGETNSATVPTAQQDGQVNALYLADDILTRLESGAANVDWWALQNGGWALYGGADLGLLSSGDCSADGRQCAPPVNTPFRPYSAMQLVGAMTALGTATLPATSTDRRVIAHAVRGPAGTVGVLLLNEDPTATVGVQLSVAGHREVAAIRYGATDTAPHPVSNPTTLPPYSLTLVVLRS